MSQGFFRLFRTGDDGTLRRSSAAAAFGTAGSSISAKRGRLYKASVVNGGATAYYVQIFDKATAPIAGDTPIWVDRLPANGSCPLQFDEGLYCVNGIGIAISTTPTTLTLAAANDAFATLQYSATN